MTKVNRTCSGTYQVLVVYHVDPNCLILNAAASEAGNVDGGALLLFTSIFMCLQSTSSRRGVDSWAETLEGGHEEGGCSVRKVEAVTSRLGDGHGTRREESSCFVCLISLSLVCSVAPLSMVADLSS